MSLRSVPAIPKENIATVFRPDKPLFIDLEDNMKIHDQGLQDADGLFYIDDQQDWSLVMLIRVDSVNSATVTAVVKAHYGASKTEIEKASPLLPIAKVSGRLYTTSPVVVSVTTLRRPSPTFRPRRVKQCGFLRKKAPFTPVPWQCPPAPINDWLHSQTLAALRGTGRN